MDEQPIIDIVEYETFVGKLAKSPTEIYDTIGPAKLHILHMAIGISGEAGEIIDTTKKHVIYNQKLDVENIKEELGDLFFYMVGLASYLGLDFEDIVNANIAKLSKRYAKGYSDKAAKERKDKQ